MPIRRAYRMVRQPIAAQPKRQLYDAALSGSCASEATASVQGARNTPKCHNALSKQDQNLKPVALLALC